jgi:hypothetical protein
MTFGERLDKWFDTEAKYLCASTYPEANVHSSRPESAIDTAAISNLAGSELEPFFQTPRAPTPLPTRDPNEEWSLLDYVLVIPLLPLLLILYYPLLARGMELLEEALKEQQIPPELSWADAVALIQKENSREG